MHSLRHRVEKVQLAIVVKQQPPAVMQPNRCMPEFGSRLIPATFKAVDHDTSEVAPDDFVSRQIASIGRPR